MSSHHYVKIYYGPCDSFHTMSYKPQKLTGLKDRLQKLGYRVDLAPVEYPDYCVLEMCGHEIFRCNIQNLRFNMPHHLDPVCQRAIAACLESTAKFTRASTYLWLWNLLAQEMFHSDYGPKDHWPRNLKKDLKRFATCLDCAKCCNILTRRNK